MVKRKGKIRTIVFDLHGVYFNLGDASYLKVCGLLGCTLEELRKAEEASGWGEHLSGRISERQFWDRMASNLGFDRKLIPKANKILYKGYRTTAGMPQLARKLGKNYRVVIFSGITKERFSHLNSRYRLNDVFDDFLLSFSVKRRKSEGGDVFFRMLLTKIKCRPDECIYVDDRMRNIVRGKALGLDSILFKNATQLKRELGKRDVDF
jgi:putative hydrolase of the HAD superfamily